MLDETVRERKGCERSGDKWGQEREGEFDEADEWRGGER